MGNANKNCARCGMLLDSGETSYAVTISAVADFDGALVPPDSPKEMSQMWKQVERKSEQELSDEVFQKVSFFLCKPCRDQWINAPFGLDKKDGVPETGHVH